MAAYLDPAALRLVLAGSENSPGTAAALSDQDLIDAIAEAQSEVDAKLAARYGSLLPFTTPPALVVNVTRDIAAYLATLTARKGDPIQTGDPVVLRYQRSQQNLTGIAVGTIALPTPDGVVGSDEAENPESVVVNPSSAVLWQQRDFGLVERPAGVDSLTSRPWPWP